MWQLTDCVDLRVRAPKILLDAVHDRHQEPLFLVSIYNSGATWGAGYPYPWRWSWWSRLSVKHAAVM